MSHWTRVPGVWALAGGFSAPFVGIAAAPHLDKLAGPVASFGLIAAFIACLFPALGFPFRDRDVLAWLQEEVASDRQRWGDAGALDWLVTGAETVLALGLLLRAAVHLLVGAIVADNLEDVEVDYGLALAPVAALDRQTRNEIRWLVGGIGVSAAGYAMLFMPPIGAAALLPQALVLVADLALALDDELGIGAVARLSEAASH